MINKKFMLIAIFIVSLLAISAVSANDVDNQIISSNDDFMDIIAMEEGSSDDDSDDSDDDYEDYDDDYDEEANTLPDDWLDYEGDGSEDYYYDEDGDGINAKLEVIQSPNDFGDTEITFRLFNIANNTPLGGVDLGVTNTYDWEYTKITTDSDGVAVYTIPFSYGAHGIEAGLWYIDDDDDSAGITDLDYENSLHCSFLRTAVNISSVPATLKLSQAGNEYGSAVLKVSLMSVSNQPLANEKVKITFSNGKSATVTTNSKGIATYSMPFAPGTYSATANVLSEGVIADSVKLNNIKIVKSAATITPTKLSTTYASGKYFQVKVTNAKTKKAMSKVKLTLKVFTGKKSKTVVITTNSKGIAKYSASTLGIGTHKIVVKVKDTKTISAKSKTSSVKISKAALKVSAPKVTNAYKQSGTFKVTVKNKESGKAMSGVKVTVKVYTGSKYKKFTVKTNSKGVASINTKSLSKTTHKVAVNIKGASKYKAASAKSSIKIIKAKLKTKIDIKECYRYSQNNWVHVKALLKDGNNKPLANKKVTVQIDIYAWGMLAASPQATLTTNSKGYIDEDLNGVLSGITEYDVKISFKGNSYYKASSASRYLY